MQAMAFASVGRLAGLRSVLVGGTRPSRSFGSVHSWRRSPSGYMGSGAATEEDGKGAPTVLVTGSCGQIGKITLRF